MDLFQAIILGIVEGITEFLPVSSTGHLILASNLLKIEQTEFVKTFEIAIQSGAILAVIVLYSQRLLRDYELIKKVLLAFIPSAAIGLFAYKFIKQYLIGNSEIVLLSLFIGGIVLIAIELLFRSNNQESGIRKNHKSLIINHKSLPYEKAFIIGVFQAISMIPGVSRAAATIVGGLLVGLDRKTAVEFSFLLAVPTMFAATALDLKETNLSFSANELLALGTGLITSFVVALVVIKWLLKYVQKHNFIAFGIYRIIASIAYSLFFFF